MVFPFLLPLHHLSTFHQPPPSLQLMRRHLTRPPNPLPVKIQHKRNRNKRYGQETQQATRPRHPQLMVHGVREERERGPERTPHQVVARIGRGDVFGVGVAEVSEHGHEEQEGAHAEECAANNRHDPVDVGAARPAEPEHTDGDEEGAEEGGLEADLGAEEALLVELWFDVLVVVKEEGDHDDEGAEEDAEEGETLGAEGEAVDVDENDGEGLKPEVEEAVDEGEVGVEEKADGFGEGEGEGADEDHQRYLLPGHAFSFELGLAFDPRVVGQFPDPHRAAIEDIAAAGLGQEEEEDDEAEAGQPHQFPDRPSPALTLCREAPDQRAESRPENGRNAPHADAIGLFLGLVDVGDAGAAGGEHGTADEAGEKAEGEDHAAVGGVDDGELEKNESEKGAEVDRVAAYVWYFGHGSLGG